MTMDRPNTRNRHEDTGAVAVIVGILAMVLFAGAAISVDLGNAFARKRDTQAQADFAALAGGPLVTGTNTKSVSDPAVLAVVDYLNKNQPLDDGESCVPTKTCIAAGQMVNDNPSDGEIYFEPNYRMRVVTPPAHVSFGLAASLGFSSTDVRAEATVGLGSPGKVVPFFLPLACTAGAMDLKSSSYNPSAPTFNPASSNGGTVARVDSVNPLTVPGAVSSTLRIYGSRFTSTLTVDYFHELSGDRVPVDLTQGLAATLEVDRSVPQADEATTVLPPRVYNTPGKWYVRVNNGSGYSSDAATFVVGSPTPPPPGCGVRATGDFGVGDSPRAGITQLSVATAMNIALGLDHELAIFEPETARPPQGTDSCNGLGATPYPGAQLDNVVRAGNNCIDVKNGMNTDTVTDGLITGGASYAGRLRTNTLDGCDRFGGSAEATRASLPTNDDVLSCFLPPGVTVGHISGTSIATEHKNSLDGRIFESPRFLTVPVIDHAVNPQNGFYPLVRYVPAFITDEAAASTKGNSYATSTNGLVIQNSKVVTVSVVVINPEALPLTADGSVGTVPYTGSGTKVVVLVN